MSSRIKNAQTSERSIHAIQEILCIVDHRQNEVLYSFCAWPILSPQVFEKVSSISRDFIPQRTLRKECFSGRDVSSLDRR
jgi:hypothetical protein